MSEKTTETVDVKHTIKTEKQTDGTVVQTETIVTTASSQAVLDVYLRKRSPARDVHDRNNSLWDSIFGKVGW